MSKTRLGLAGLAGILGCAACCAIPLLAAAGLGGGTAASLSWFFRPGAELVIGLVTAAVVFGAVTLWQRRRPAPCGPACQVDGSCCGAKP